MREVRRSPFGFNIAFQVTEYRMPPIYAHGNHIQAAAPVVLPFGAAVLVMLNVMWF